MCTQSPSRLTLINAYACIRVDLPDGTYTLTQEEEEGAASGELNQIGVQQDLDQVQKSPRLVLVLSLRKASTGFI
jgi:hypothetical protein